MNPELSTNREAQTTVEDSAWGESYQKDLPPFNPDQKETKNQPISEQDLAAKMLDIIDKREDELVNQLNTEQQPGLQDELDYREKQKDFIVQALNDLTIQSNADKTLFDVLTARAEATQKHIKASQEAGTWDKLTDEQRSEQTERQDEYQFLADWALEMRSTLEAQKYQETKQEPWSVITDYPKEHTFDPTLYRSESEWRTANHFDATRPKIIAEAVGTYLNDYDYIDQASQKAADENITIHQALAKIFSQNPDNDAALEAMETFEKMTEIDIIEHCNNKNYGTAQALKQYVEFQLESLKFKKEPTDPSFYGTPFTKIALYRLYTVIDQYLKDQKEDNYSQPIAAVLEQQFNHLQEKAKPTGELSEQDTIIAQGLKLGLNEIALLMDDYESEKNTLDKIFKSY